MPAKDYSFFDRLTLVLVVGLLAGAIILNVQGGLTAAQETRVEALPPGTVGGAGLSMVVTDDELAYRLAVPAQREVLRVYQTATDCSLLDAPAGGSYDFRAAILTPPSGWRVLQESADACTSEAVVRTSDTDALWRVVPTWGVAF